MRFLALVAAAAALSCGGSEDRFKPGADASTEPPASHPEGEIRAFGLDLQKLKPNVSATTVFGHAISVEGDTLAVGAMVEGGNVGRVYVFVRAGATWTLQQKLQASDPTSGVRFGKSVDLSGNTLIVGAAGEAGNPQVGAAYVFTRTGSTWTEQQKIVAPDGQAQDRFGQVVRVDGDTAVIGAIGDDDKGSDAGSTYIFVRSGTTWSQQQKITAADGAPGDQFGYGVAIAGDTVAIGARRDDTAALTDHGSVYVFVRSGTTWSQQQKIVAGDAAGSDHFGRSVAVFGQTLLIGAAQRVGTANGAAYVFTRSGVTWSLQQKLTASDGQPGDLFGADVALFGDVAAISQRFDDDSASNAGAVYVFTRAGATWTQAQKLRPSDGQTEDRFGQAVDVHGTTLVGGSAGDDDLANNSGAAYVFESPVLTNGSFETGNYSGWTLAENSGSATAGVYGIATDGQTINGGASVFDFFNGVNVAVSSPGLPNTYDATEGNFVAFHLQSNSENHRMFQTVAVPPCGAVLRWDMEYQNFNPFDPVSQFTAVNIRDATTDAILGTVFKTVAGSPTTVAPMTPFEVDVSAFAGQTVRLDFEHQVQQNFFDISWDNIRIQCGSLSAKLAVSPSPHTFADQLVGTTSANQTFTITNQGSANLVVNSITTSAPFTVTPPTLPATIAPGANTTFTGQFSPTATGLANGSISIVSNDGPASINVSGTGIAPAISVSPGSHNFGNQRVGTTSAGKTFAITNTGTSTLNVSSITTTGPFATADTSFSVAPGNTQNISGTFSPTATGAASGTIRINHDAAGSPTDITLSGTGIQPTISVSATLAFADQRVGTTSAGKTLTISNTGTDTLNISSITTTGPFATANSPVTIAAGNSANISVTFSPTATGSASGTLRLTHDAPGSPTDVALSGTGIQPAISVNATLAFGNQRVGTTSAGNTLTISNTGTDTLNISSITTTGPFATANSPVTIAAGNSANISVTFSPTATGSASGTLRLTHDAPGSPTDVALSGTGIQPAISIPASVAFGNQRVGTTSAPTTVTISNTGTDTLNVSAITTTGPFATANQSFSIAAGNSQNISVTFSPGAPGSASGTLRITHDAPGSPSTSSLSGTGIIPAISVASSLTFADQRVGTTSAGNTLTISNTGTDTLTISAITTSGPFATANTPLSIPAGNSANISITFSPLTPGLASGDVLLAHDAPGSFTSVTLSGTGIQPVITIDPSSLSFGDQRVGTTSTTRTFDITNAGDDTLTITDLTATAPFALTSSTLPITLSPSGSTTVSVTFSPAAAGAFNDVVTITSDAGNGATKTVVVDGQGVEPVISATTLLPFGDVRTNTSANLSLVVTNNGTSDLTLTALNVSPPFTNASAFPIVLGPSASTNLTVTFTPTATGAIADSLVILSDASTSPTTVGLTGNGVEPLASPDVSAVDFGLQRVGLASQPRTVVLTNPGAFPLTVSSVTTSAPFEVTSSTAFVVQPSQSVAIDLRFTPAAEGLASGTLTIAHDATGAPTTVSLEGTGTIAELDASPSTLMFGEIRVGTTSATQPITVRNLGLAPLTISSITPSTGFVATGLTVPRNVLPNASVTFDVAFAPGTAGAAAGTVAIGTSVGTTNVELGGTAVTAALTADRLQLDLGTVLLGEASAVQLVQLTNVTDAPISIATATVTDPQFVLDPAPVTTPIPPGGSIMFGVRFVPGNGGAAIGQVDVVLAGETAVEVSIQTAGQGLLEEGGCCSTGGGGGSSSLLLGFVVLGLIRRRRR